VPADRTCSLALIKAGENYATTRLQAIEGCRDRIDSGQLALTFDACPTDGQTMRTIHRAAASARKGIAAACDATMPAGVGCAAMLDDVISPDASTGCLIDVGNQTSDQLAAAAYGPSLAGGPNDALTCQPALGTAGRRTFISILTALDNCRTGGTPSVDSCLTDPTFLAAVKNAGSAARSRIKSKCTANALLEVGACATTLDGLVSPSFDGGCLLTTHRDGAATIATTFAN
jgi:hypothetical protein